jgi:nitrate/TMAO reductase-like tetraheme cytochrome c subunit
MPIIESPKPAPAPAPIGQPPIDPSARRRRFRLIAFVVVVGLVLITGVGFAVATALEEQDSFCISCHTAPEITYYNRAYIALDTANAIPEDLSTRHYLAGQASGTPFRCIDCHRGDSGLPHRVSAVALGAYDALIFFSGRYDSSIEKQNTKSGWLANASCVTCHADTLLLFDGINNHFHNYLPQVQTALARGGQIQIGEALASTLKDGETPTAEPVAEVGLQCSSCHQAHKALIGGATTFFMDTDLRNTACVDCHIKAGQGPQDVRALSGND